jgi:gluconate 2-dehydrogenase gamma chain
MDTSTTPDITRRQALVRLAGALGLALSPALLDTLARAQSGPATAAVRLPADDFATLQAVTERILPRTDTPGANDVGVPAFLDLLIADYLSPAERTVILNGLKRLDDDAQRAHRKPFRQLAATEQDQLLQATARAAAGTEGSFFHLVKDLTILGYFTSEEVGKNVTRWDPVPGRFDACIPVSEVGNRAWTR